MTEKPPSRIEAMSSVSMNPTKTPVTMGTPQLGIGTIGALPTFSLPVPEADADASIALGGNSDTAAAEARSVRIFSEAVLTCLEISDMFASENKLMAEDAIRHENACHASDLKFDQDLDAVVHMAKHRVAKAIGDSIRHRFNLPASGG
jgi:hypothetical protein